MSKALSVAALVAGSIITAPGVEAEPPGRLFFTPTERKALDAGKQSRTPRSSQAPAVRGPREVTLDGIVTRSDGEATVWVNGRVLDERPVSGVSATPSGSDPAAARVTVGGVRSTVGMRVGQRFERSTGKIAEPYEAIAGRTLVTTPVGKERGPAAREERAPSNLKTIPKQASDN